MIRKYTAYSSWNDALSRFPQCLDIEIQDGSTLLHLAALDENISAMDFLVHHSVPVDVGNAMRATPLMVAAYKGCRTSVEWLLNHGANVDAKDIFYLTALHVAQDDPILVDLLFNRGALLDATDEQGSTPLMIYISRRHEAASQSLIDHGARVDSVNHKGGSALLYALVTHSYDLVPLLIKSGARWQETDAQGRSILTRLIETNTSNLERCLDSFPQLIDVPECEYDLFPVTRAIELDYTHHASILIHRGLGQSTKQEWYRRWLIRCVELKQAELIKLLVLYGADCSRVDSNGTLLHRAVVRGNESIVCFFLSQGVDCDAVDAHGNTALHWASLLGYETIAQMLVESGAMTNLVNRDNYTPWKLACQHGHYQKAIRILYRLKESLREYSRPTEYNTLA